MNQFNGFSISDATLLLPAESDGTNLIGNTTLPNPSVLHLQVGTINLNLKAGDIVIGNASLQDVTLVPGDNVYPLKGILDLKTVIKNLAAVLEAEASAIKSGNLSINAVTTSVVWNNTLVPYYTDVLRELTLTASVGLADILKNTIAYLKSQGNLTEIISNLTGNDSDSSLIPRAMDESIKRKPVSVAAWMRQNLHVRELFDDIDPDKRDALIHSIASFYPTL